MSVLRLPGRSRSASIAFGSFVLVHMLSARAQSAWHDPQGRYELIVPTGWTATPDTGVDQIILRKGSLQAVIAVFKQKKDDTMKPNDFVGITAREFQGQCPTFREVQSGAVTLAGAPGFGSLFTCSDPKSPTVAETSSTVTSNSYLVGFTTIAPLATYYDNLPAFDAIRDSLKIIGSNPQTAPAGSTQSPAMAELKKACLVGVFTQEDCARHIADLSAKQDPAPADSKTQSANTYQDPQGRFSFKIPDGWTASVKGDNGSLGVQVRSGSSWINITPAPAAQNTNEVVLAYERQIAAQSNSGRTPPFGPSGLSQFFSNGIETSYDHFGGVSTDGTAVESWLAGIGESSAPAGDHLLLIASFGQQQSADGGKAFFIIAQSVHLASH